MRHILATLLATLMIFALCAGCGTTEQSRAFQTGTSKVAGTWAGQAVDLIITMESETTGERQSAPEAGGLAGGIAGFLASLFSGGLLGGGPLTDIGAAITAILAALSNRNAPTGKWWGHPLKPPGTVTVTDEEFDAAVEAKIAAIEAEEKTEKTGFQGKGAGGA